MAQDSGREIARFYYDVAGNNVLLSPLRDIDLDNCVGATADPAVLRKIAASVSDGEVSAYGQFELERVPYPNFGPSSPEGYVGGDRSAVVNGQRVAPWCGSDVFYWIRGFSPSPAPTAAVSSRK
jgi:hypothetical protein